MRLIPRNTRGKLAFYRSHVEPWTDHATDIGSSPAEVADYAAKVDAAEAAFRAQQQAQAAAQAATLAFQQAMDAVATSCGSIVMQIRSKARSVGNSVYALASVDVPNKPSPVDAPGKPTDFAIQLNGDGSLQLTWKSDNPKESRGTVYEVRRAMGMGQPFEYLTVVGKKRTYTDTSLPKDMGGRGLIIYQITPMRSTKKGVSAQFPVQFGGGAPVAHLQSSAKAA